MVSNITHCRTRTKSKEALECQYSRIEALYSALIAIGNKEHLDRLKERAQRAKHRYLKVLTRFNISDATSDVYMHPKEYRNMDIIMDKVHHIEQLFDEMTAHIGETRINQLVNRYKTVVRLGYIYLSNMEDVTQSPFEVIHRDIYKNLESHENE